MDLGLQGKVAWVLGASSGLGRASAHSLAREGCAVALSARDPEHLEQAAQEIAGATGSRCHPVPLDVTDGEAISAAATRIAEELGPVDVLVANAGGPPAGSFAEMNEDDLSFGFALTTASAWRLAKVVLPAMRERGSGCLIFITSSSTKEVIPGLLLSNSLRPAVVGMAKTLSKEEGAQGIRALCVAPGRVATPRVEELDELHARNEGKPIDEVRAQSQARIPLGRYGRTEEVGDVVAFLASERA
ncbi:MAG TPA: SDR family oxidoreductase, partial [Actinomycetota bacterium]|nr:SDR family oxidoreductase [Actinomycetota bacterium]